MEELESRQLLSAVPIPGPQKLALSAELDKLVSYAEHVEAEQSLQGALPLIGQSFDAQLDLSDVLEERFAVPLANFLINSESNLTSDEVSAFLVSDAIVGNFDGLEFSVGPTSGTEINGELVFDTTLYANRSVDYRLDLGDAAATAGVRIDDSLTATSAADFHLAFDFQFGVDGSGQFFAEIESLQVGVTDAVELVADAATPTMASIPDPITFSLLLNDSITVTATLPANSSGNLTPLTQRLTRALRQPLSDAGFENGLIATETRGKLAFRSLSPEIASLEIIDGGGLATLGFADGQSASARFQPNLEYGLLGLETVVGGLAIDGAFDVIADDGGDGRMNVLELSGQPVLTTQTRGRGEFLAKVQPATGAIVAGNPAVGGVASPLFGDTPIIVTTESFSELDRLHDQVRETLLVGFAAITQFGTRLESETELANVLPAMNTSLGQQADFDAVLRDKLQATIEALLADNARPSWQDVRAALSAVDGVTVSAIARTDDQVSFDLQVADNKSSLQKLVDGQTAEDAGFAAAANALPELNLQAMTQWMLQIDIRSRGDRLAIGSIRGDFRTS